ncbi:MAG: hypothetical protein AAFY03_10245 [Pseudomonadota bacterium]
MAELAFHSLKQARRHVPGLLSEGPLAVIFDEDGVETHSTVQHHLSLGFRRVLLFSQPETLRATLPSGAVVIESPALSAKDIADCLTRIARSAKRGLWIYWGFNAEYLYIPFCEARTIGDCLDFHASERREAMLAPVIDLYASDLKSAPNAVDLGSAHFDGAGYYALSRGGGKERQLDLFGGLRWRYEEWVPQEGRRIDRIALFRANPARTLREDFTFTEEELNTYACPWHHNVIAAIPSFRAAKALLHNPGSREALDDLMWERSVPFLWSSQQLMDHGFMEPGQWV